MNESRALEIIRTIEALSGQTKEYPMAYWEAKGVLSGLESERKRAGKLLLNYWKLLQRFYDADKQMLPKWHDAMFQDQQEIARLLAEYEHPTGDEGK